MNPVSELYEARMRRFNATPGSREWWRAIRDIRAIRARFREMFRAFGEAFKAVGRAITNALSGLGETLSAVMEAQQ